jgi:hypothetical protein
MIRWLLACICLIQSLSAHLATTENAPDSLVEGIVSAITGELYLLEEDLVVQGYEPIHLQRSYISAKNSSWNFFSHLEAKIYANLLFIPEPNGTILEYSFSMEENFGKSKTRTFRPIREMTGFTNIAHGEISARTNLKNNHAVLNKNTLTLYSADGTTRIYQEIIYKKPGIDRTFLLSSEELLNGNKILYFWDQYNNLQKISTESPLGTPFASLTVSYAKDASDLIISTSDGKNLSYHFSQEGGWYLQEINKPENPDQTLRYEDGKLVEIRFPENRVLYIKPLS